MFVFSCHRGEFSVFDIQWSLLQLVCTIDMVMFCWVNDDLIDSVLATLVKNKVVPDPFYGLENEAIVDIADSGREYYTFWFFITFQCKLVCNNIIH